MMLWSRSYHLMQQQPLPRASSVLHQHRRLPHLLFLLFLFSLTSCSNGITANQTKKESSVPLLGTIPDTSFRCQGRSAGYYADEDTGCQVYHMCDSLERQYSYLCPNYTLFNQKFMVCDHWYMVECASSHTFYHLNTHIGEVPDKNEESHNLITTGHKDEPPPSPSRANKGTSLHTPSPPRPSRKPSTSGFSTPTLHPAFQPSETKIKPSAFKTHTNSVTHSTRFPVPPSTPKPNVSTINRVFTPITLPPKTPVSHSFQSPVRPQQSPAQSREQLSSRQSQEAATTITTTIPTTPPSTTPVSRSRQQFTNSNSVTQSRQPVSQSRHPATLPTSSFTHSRQSVSQSVTPSTSSVTRSFSPSVSPPSKPGVSSPSPLTPPSQLLTLPNTEFRDGGLFRGDQGSRGSRGHRITHTDNSNSNVSISSSLTPPNVDHTPGHKKIKTAGLETDSTKPGSVARSPGNRFTFTNRKEEEGFALTPEELQRIVLRPLLVRPRIKTRRVLTNTPTLLPIDPTNSSDPHHHHFPMRIEFPDPVIPEDKHSRSSLDLKLSNSHRSSHASHPHSSHHPPPLSTVLSPPTHPFTLSGRVKQEFPTRLVIPTRLHALPRTSPRDTFLPGSSRLPFLPSTTRGNRAFFIPPVDISSASLLVPDLPQNIVDEQPSPHDSNHHHHHNHDHHHHHHNHHDHMTMVFPAPIEQSMMEQLRLNPDCPRCHPEFLKPGQCHPCVVIK